MLDLDFFSQQEIRRKGAFKREVAQQALLIDIDIFEFVGWAVYGGIGRSRHGFKISGNRGGKARRVPSTGRTMKTRRKEGNSDKISIFDVAFISDQWELRTARKPEMATAVPSL